MLRKLKDAGMRQTGETARTQEMFKHVTMGLKRGPMHSQNLTWNLRTALSHMCNSGRKPPPLPEAPVLDTFRVREYAGRQNFHIWTHMEVS